MLWRRATVHRNQRLRISGYKTSVFRRINLIPARLLAARQAAVPQVAQVRLAGPVAALPPAAVPVQVHPEAVQAVAEPVRPDQ
jgi:hypothetical protein